MLRRATSVQYLLPGERKAAPSIHSRSLRRFEQGNQNTPGRRRSASKSLHGMWPPSMARRRISGSGLWDVKGSVKVWRGYESQTGQGSQKEEEKEEEEGKKETVPTPQTDNHQRMVRQGIGNAHYLALLPSSSLMRSVYMCLGCRRLSIFRRPLRH